MWQTWASNPVVRTSAIALAAILFVAAVVLAYRAWRRSRITPEERERRRREALAARGKMGDATLVEIRDDLLIYSYLVRGVIYTASQDISRLQGLLPHDFSTVGAVIVKYDPRNPANSIVVAEQWNGLHATKVG
jgi:hypothetical protein